jgi:hypothetical protein
MAARVIADQQAKEARESGEVWDTLVGRYGVTTDTLIREELVALENFILARRYIIEQAQKAEPTEGDFWKIYREEPELFKLAPSRRACEILLSSPDWSMERTRDAWKARRAVRDRARELREKILNGYDFGEAAKRYSVAESASKGGELGWIQEPSSAIMDVNLSKLEIGEISPPIATSRGYLLLQLQEVKEGDKMTYEEAREKCMKIWAYRQLKRVEDSMRQQFLRK